MSDPIPYRVRRRTFSIFREPSAPPEPKAINSAETAARYLLPFFKAADAGQEHFAALYLDQRGRPIAGKILFSGSLGETAVHPGVVARNALLVGATGVIVAHCHPSGILSPSSADLAVTSRLRDGLALLDISLLDSLILGIDAGTHRSILP